MMGDSFDPYGPGLTETQLAQRDAALQRLDATLRDVTPDTAALARAVVETMFFANLHLDANTRQYVIAQRESLHDDITHAIGIIDRGLSVTMQVSEQTIAHIETLSQRIGTPPADDPRTLMERMLATERAIRRRDTIALVLAVAILIVLIAMVLLGTPHLSLCGASVAMLATIGAWVLL